MENRDRFTGRSENYSKYRPGYPVDLISVLEMSMGLTRDTIVADIGSGTGILARLFLDNGNRVYCIEPNDDMRARAESDLSGYANATVIEGTAESTGLPDQSVDMIVAGQAYHWFDREASSREFRRIVSGEGSLVLVWNDRVDKDTGINAAYEEICRKYGKGYHRSGSSVLEPDFADQLFREGLKKFLIPNPQKIDMETLKGRYLSSSYSLNPDDERYPGLIKALEKAFEKNKKKGFVTMEYETKVYAGKLLKS